MASAQEVPVQQKQEVEKREESTIPARTFVPMTDIYEKDNTLCVVMEMPGVGKNNVDVQVEEGVLRVEGRLDFSEYTGLQPVYTEYNVGHYKRSFELSGEIDVSKIEAEMADGVLSLVPPKAESAKPRTIQVR